MSTDTTTAITTEFPFLVCNRRDEIVAAFLYRHDAKLWAANQSYDNGTTWRVLCAEDHAVLNTYDEGFVVNEPQRLPR